MKLLSWGHLEEGCPHAVQTFIIQKTDGQVHDRTRRCSVLDVQSELEGWAQPLNLAGTESRSGDRYWSSGFILFMHSVLHNSPLRSSWVARSGSQTWARGWTPGLWHKRVLQLDAACLGPSEKLGAWLHRKSNKRLIRKNRKLHHHLWLLKWLNYLSCSSTVWMLLHRWSNCSDAQNFSKRKQSAETRKKRNFWFQSKWFLRTIDLNIDG